MPLSLPFLLVIPRTGSLLCHLQPLSSESNARHRRPIPLTSPRDPPGNATRPTSDRLRETLFNVLGPRIATAHFADLYAGSGAVGIEALSRGAVSCLFAERGPAAVTAIRKNLETLGLARQASLDTRSVARALTDAVGNRRRFDLVFLDPPYEAFADYNATLGYLAQQHDTLLASEALVIAEHAKRTLLPERFGSLVRGRVLEQGDAALSFYAVAFSEPVEG